MGTNSERVVHYLPFLRIEKPIQIGKFQLIPFPERTDLIEESKLIPFIEKITNSYQHAKSKSIQGITLMKNLDKPWMPLDEEGQSLIWRTNIILCFCCLATNELSPNKAYRNSTNFQLITQYLTLDSDSFSVQTRTRWGTMLTGGYRWGEHIQGVPNYIGSEGETRFDEFLLSIFNKILKAKVQPFSELDIALEWFYWANTDSPFTNLDLEAVLMASAFEALFKVPFDEPSKRKALSEAIRRHFNKYKRITTKRNDANGTSTKTRGWKEFWMEEFYWYRNCIAHGSKPDWKSRIWNSLEHLLIAYKIFIDAVRVKFESEINLKLDIETKAYIAATDEIIEDGKIFNKDWDEILLENQREIMRQEIKKRSE